jgi:hypothetical protein
MRIIEDTLALSDHAAIAIEVKVVPDNAVTSADYKWADN